MRIGISEWFKSAHQEGVTPYAYHTDDDGNRHQHYVATACWTFLISIPFVSFFPSVLNIGKAIPTLAEHSVTRQLIGGIGLLFIAVLMGSLASTLHFIVDEDREIKDRSNYSVQLDNRDPGEDEVELQRTNTPINETTGLVGQSQGGASLFRLGNHHPLQLIYPPTPLKTGLWIPIAGLIVFALASLIKPNLFNEFVGHAHIINGTNCTFFNSTNIDSEIMSNNTVTTICSAGFGFMLGTMTLSALGLFLIFATPVGIATLSHWMAAKAAQSCQEADDVDVDVEPTSNLVL